MSRGSILDDEFVSMLGEFDLVYAWGVLHHTGALWDACDKASKLVRSGGRIVVAIYNDQKILSKYWRMIKYVYNAVPACRPLILAAHAPYLIGVRILVRTIRSKTRLERGMSYWYDMVDWLGGYPFEVASPEEVVSFFRNRRFELERQSLCGRRHGCNEFVFRKHLDSKSG